MSGDPAAPVKAILLAAGRGSRMGGDLPKVLHELDGKPLISYAVDNAREAGAEPVVVVVGYRRELVQAKLADSGVEFAVQTEQRGTGHAVLAARGHLEADEADILVLYGDMPLLSTPTLRQLIMHRRATAAAAVALTLVIDSPPDFGRIVRDEAGRVQRVVEVKDANADELAIREVNVGAYCFAAQTLLPVLERLRTDNAQGEYYLTDVVGLLVQDGHRVETVETTDIEETLGINDLPHLAFAGTLDDIRYAESLYELVDAVANAARGGP
ncbi:MAG: NTP transferase domain-containing protein [Propionibacteriales bacterium]|nr:NTP transferase domain-containing protein [Propionibacteriales bacterium]